MTKQVPDALFPAVFAGVVGFVFAFVPADFWADLKPVLGAPLVDLLRVVTFLASAAFSFAVLHYFGVLGAGAQPVGTRERSDYDALRQKVASGNWVAREYTRKLHIFLDAIERFFGDAGMSDETLLSRAFGLRRPAPLWTAPAFDRCLLLALIYPIAAILLIWAVSNDIGPAEHALGLRATDGRLRAVTVALVGFLAFSFWLFAVSEGWRRVAWLVVAGAVAFAFAFAVAVAFAFAFAVAGAGAGAVAVAGAGAGAGAVAVAFAGAVAFADRFSRERGWQGVFLFGFFIVTILLCFAGAALLSRLPDWPRAGPLLLFLGLLTLLNAPFDWLSLGLTRALMRRGLEGGPWSPYGYAVIDALLASAVIAALAMAMVAGAQWFDDIAVYGGGERIFPPMPEFLDAIKAHPEKPEYWWVYATLFSTMLPSLINLFLAGISLARGVPGISSWLLGKVREGEAVPAYDRLQVAIVLTLQNVVGIAFAVVAQGFLFWIIIWQGMPLLGIGVFDLASHVVH